MPRPASELYAELHTNFLWLEENLRIGEIELNMEVQLPPQ